MPDTRIILPPRLSAQNLRVVLKYFEAAAR
jgi:hypothetical protein